MGKSRRNRAKPRKDPLTKAAKAPSDPELAALREKSVLPVIRDLQSSDPMARTSAAAAVSNLVSDTKCRKLFLREQIVHIVLTETLTDSSPESRAAGWDILRVLAEEEEADFCIHLFRQDVLGAIDFAAVAVIETLSSSAKLGKAEAKVLWSIVESIVALLSALSEAQDEILEAVTGLEATVKLLFAVISSTESPSVVRLDALSCLLTLTEDNQRLAEIIVTDEEPKPFSTLVNFQSGTGAGRVISCGILHNIFTSLKWYEGSPGNKDLSDASLVRTLSISLDEPKLDQDLPENCQWSKPAEVLQLALEILASIGTSIQESMAKSHLKEEAEWDGIADGDAMEDESTAKGKGKGKAKANEKQSAEDEDDEMDDSRMEEGVDDDDDDDDDDDNIDDIQADMEMVTGADDGMDEDAPPDDLSTLGELVSKAIPRIIQFVNPSSVHFVDAAKLQDPALSALNNFAWSVGCFDFSKDENAPILDIWTPAGKAIWQGIIEPVLAANTADIELASKVTSLAWAVARTMPGDRLPIRGDEHQKFMSLYQAAKKLHNRTAAAAADAEDGTDAPAEDEEDPFQGLGVKCIGVLGQLAADLAPVQRNREIGVFLTTVASALPDAPPADVIEALNQLFDIYGDEDKVYDKEVFWKDNILGHLQDLQPKVKAMLKTIDKRRHGELRLRADEVSLNLGRFVQYKQKHKP